MPDPKKKSADESFFLDVPTDDLVAELARRFPSMVFVAERPAESTTGEVDSEYQLRWFGGATMALGLIARAKFRLSRMLTDAPVSGRPGIDDDE